MALLWTFLVMQALMSTFLEVTVVADNDGLHGHGISEAGCEADASSVMALLGELDFHVTASCPAIGTLRRGWSRLWHLQYAVNRAERDQRSRLIPFASWPK